MAKVSALLTFSYVLSLRDLRPTHRHLIPVRQRLADRSPAHPEVLGQLFFTEMVAWSVLADHDVTIATTQSTVIGRCR